MAVVRRQADRHAGGCSIDWQTERGAHGRTVHSICGRVLRAAHECTRLRMFADVMRRSFSAVSRARSASASRSWWWPSEQAKRRRSRANCSVRESESRRPHYLRCLTRLLEEEEDAPTTGLTAHGHAHLLLPDACTSRGQTNQRSRQ